MKKSNIILKVFILLVFSSLNSCSKNDSPAPDNSIVGTLAKNPSLKLFSQAVSKTNLTSLLQGTGPYTVFAPSNDAFTAYMTDKNYANLDAIPQETLKQLILNHIISGFILSSGLTTGYVKTFALGSSSTTNYLSMYIDTNGGQKINGIASITTPNIVPSNGVIHIIDKVLELPTILTHINANQNLTTLNTLINSIPQATFLTSITNNGLFTFFAPTNAAFTSLDTELTANGGLAGISDVNNTKVLNYHVTNGAILSNSLTNNQIISTLQTPQTFTLQTSSSFTILDINNRTANITVRDIQCDNGVLYIIDKVLLPNF